MHGTPLKIWTCMRCLLAQQRGVKFRYKKTDRDVISSRTFRDAACLRAQDSAKQSDQNDGKAGAEQGAMSRRLSEMAEETMDSGSKSDRKLMKEAGFSEDLKSQLEQRIAESDFKAQNQTAFSEADLPRSAGKAAKDIATAAPWTGTESIQDATLRMLDDSHKKLRSPSRPPRIPQKPNLRPPPKKNVSPADRLANARDKTSIYAFSQQQDLTEKEREQMRKDLKERFTPAARPIPTTLQGLTSLANERIEDAIARGQFKNIPRGKGANVEKDHNANSPFLDTTEYFMNKIIQKQEIVPPWIEKQQELVKTVNSFRSRLRSEWRRHAARMIASSGGSIDDQVRRAKGYALAEEKINPRVNKSERLSSISSDGSLTNVTVEERIASGVVEEVIQDKKEPEIAITVTETPMQNINENENEAVEAATPATSIPTQPNADQNQNPQPPPTPTPPSQPSVLPMASPFRDSTWETAERAYHTLAVDELNSLTRSYNLMAPKIAQKPYYNLQRELNRCFADVAPTVADEIRERSRRPVIKIQLIGHKEGGVMEKFGAGKYEGHTGTFRDEAEGKGYGFRQFWRDLFRREKQTA